MKKTKKEVEVPQDVAIVEEPQGVQEPVVVKVSPITESFGSGDMNTLKNKINEIIALM